MKGLQYLHDMSVMHGNLTPSNVLVNLSGDAIVSDFSLSKSLLTESPIFTQSNGPSGSFRYMPPEIYGTAPLTTQADVYSWGMTALEIITGRTYPHHPTP
jgi:serine/threonine protein kinase